MLSRLVRALSRTGEILVFVGMTSLSATVLVSMADIIGRKTIGFSVLGIDDMVSLTVMACVSLAMPLTYLREGHVAVEFVTDPLPPRWLAAAKMVAAILTAGFVVVLAWYAFKQAAMQIGQGDRSNTLAIPVLAYWAPLLLGLTMSALCALVLALRWIAAVFARKAPAAPGGTASA